MDKDEKRTTGLGLKKLRKRSGEKPTYECGNCNCKRYSPCTCMKKKGN
jgi:hypothetical protein